MNERLKSWEIESKRAKIKVLPNDSAKFPEHNWKVRMYNGFLYFLTKESVKNHFEAENE